MATPNSPGGDNPIRIDESDFPAAASTNPPGVRAASGGQPQRIEITENDLPGPSRSIGQSPSRPTQGKRTVLCDEDFQSQPHRPPASSPVTSKPTQPSPAPPSTMAVSGGGFGARTLGIKLLAFVILLMIVAAAISYYATRDGVTKSAEGLLATPAQSVDVESRHSTDTRQYISNIGYGDLIGKWMLISDPPREITYTFTSDRRFIYELVAYVNDGGRKVRNPTSDLHEEGVFDIMKKDQDYMINMTGRSPQWLTMWREGGETFMRKTEVFKKVE